MIERVVRILDTFSTDRTVQTASEIGERSGLPTSTAHRLVSELVQAGILERDSEHRIRLGMRLWELALRGSTALRLRQAALPHMETVQAEIREHTQLAVLEREEALFLERLSHPEAGANITRIAGRLPLHASSSGLVLLAHAEPAFRERILTSPLESMGPGTITDAQALRQTLADIRRSGSIVAPGSIESVSTGIAVPVREYGLVIAALSVVLPRSTPTGPAERALTRAAKAIEADLQQSRP